MNAVMTSKINKPLDLTLFISTEGFSLTHNVDSYESMLTFKEYCDHFVAEKNSSELDEKQKMQRDVSVTDGRVKGIIEYIKKGAAIFPSVTVFLSDLTINQALNVGNKEMVLATLMPDTDRMVSDGQGRLTSITALMAELTGNELESLSNMTIAVKFVVTKTATIYEARQIVRQTFSDYHISLKKPSSSLSLYFDSSTPYGLLMQTLLNVTVKDKPLVEWISLKGKITGTQAWTLAMFANFITTALGKTKSSLNAELKDEACFAGTVATMEVILPTIFNLLPLEVLTHDDIAQRKINHDQALFTKALFITGLGYLVRSLMEDAISSESAPAFDSLKVLESLPLADKTCDTLKTANIIDEDNKIISKSDKRIAAFLCKKARIMPCEALTA